MSLKFYIIFLPLLSFAIGLSIKGGEQNKSKASSVKLESQTLGPEAPSSQVTNSQTIGSLTPGSITITSQLLGPQAKETWRSNQVQNTTTNLEKEEAASEYQNKFVGQKSNPYKSLLSGFTEEKSPARNLSAKNSQQQNTISGTSPPRQTSIQNYFQNTVSLETKSTVSDQEITSISDEPYNPYTELLENPSSSTGSIQNYISNVIKLSPQ